MSGPKALSLVEAHEAIHRILEHRDAISFSHHLRERMRQRAFTMDDVRRVLLYGVVRPSPQWNAEYEHWVYLVSGTDYDNDPLAIVVALEPVHSRITAITGHDV
jgi:uncharacterized protein DUF4258